MKHVALLIWVILISSACGGDGASAPDPDPAVLQTYSNDNPPDIDNPGPLTVLEGQREITNIYARDPENRTVTQRISGGPDASKFSLTESGNLSFTPDYIPDYENPSDANTDNVYQLVITASDGTLDASLSLSVRWSAQASASACVIQ